MCCSLIFFQGIENFDYRFFCVFIIIIFIIIIIIIVVVIVIIIIITIIIIIILFYFFKWRLKVFQTELLDLTLRSIGVAVEEVKKVS